MRSPQTSSTELKGPANQGLFTYPIALPFAETRYVELLRMHHGVCLDELPGRLRQSQSPLPFRHIVAILVNDAPFPPPAATHLQEIVSKLLTERLQ